MFRIRVALDRQAPQVYGQPTVLQPGMQLDADVMLDTRNC